MNTFTCFWAIYKVECFSKFYYYIYSVWACNWSNKNLKYIFFVRGYYSSIANDLCKRAMTEGKVEIVFFCKGLLCCSALSLVVRAKLSTKVLYKLSCKFSYGTSKIVGNGKIDNIFFIRRFLIEVESTCCPSWYWQGISCTAHLKFLWCPQLCDSPPSLLHMAHLNS